MYLVAFILTLIAFNVAGIGGLVVCGLAILPFWYYAAKRGLLFIQAYVFLQALEDGYEIEGANLRAARVGIWNAREEIALRAKVYALRHYEGQQLRLIQEAKAKGFKSWKILAREAKRAGL